MKKWFSVLFVVVLLFSSIALADEPVTVFSIRNGVQFGDSVDDVKSKDDVFKNAVAEPYEDLVINPTTFEMSTVLLYPACLSENVELAGAPVSMYYYFTDSGLKEILYRTSTNAREKPSMKTLETAYDILKPALIQKYGKELDENDVLAYITEAPAVGTISKSANANERNAFWLLEYDNYYVKIYLYSHRTDASSVYFGLSYYMITKSEMEAIVQEYGDKVNQFADELNNSI